MSCASRACRAGSTVREYGPGGSSEIIRTSESGAPPTAAMRSASTTPVHSASALQPSTHAMGSRWVACGRADNSATVNGPHRGPVRHRSGGSRATVALRSTPAAIADRFTGTPCGPCPDRGASTGTRRRKPHRSARAVTAVASATATQVARSTVRRRRARRSHPRRRTRVPIRRLPQGRAGSPAASRRHVPAPRPRPR